MAMSRGRRSSLPVPVPRARGTPARRVGAIIMIGPWRESPQADKPGLGARGRASGEVCGSYGVSLSTTGCGWVIRTQPAAPIAEVRWRLCGEIAKTPSH
jgi:hypothetical protein